MLFFLVKKSALLWLLFTLEKRQQELLRFPMANPLGEDGEDGVGSSNSAEYLLHSAHIQIVGKRTGISVAGLDDGDVARKLQRDSLLLSHAVDRRKRRRCSPVHSSGE